MCYLFVYPIDRLQPKAAPTVPPVKQKHMSDCDKSVSLGYVLAANTDLGNGLGPSHRVCIVAVA